MCGGRGPVGSRNGRRRLTGRRLQEGLERDALQGYTGVNRFGSMEESWEGRAGLWIHF